MAGSKKYISTESYLWMAKCNELQMPVFRPTQHNWLLLRQQHANSSLQCHNDTVEWATRKDSRSVKNLLQFRDTVHPEVTPERRLINQRVDKEVWQRAASQERFVTRDSVIWHRALQWAVTPLLRTAAQCIHRSREISNAFQWAEQSSQLPIPVEELDPI